MTKKTSVKRWQTLLNKAEFNCGKVDGIKGKKTNAATIAFKKTVFKNPKDWNAGVGNKTLSAMYFYLLRRKHKARKTVKPIISIPKVFRYINTIVIHYSASGDVSAKTIDRWHKARGFSRIGYHFVIRRNGKIERGRPLSQIGAHVKGHNTGSIGIVLPGADTLSWYPAKAQLDSARRLVRDIKKVYKIKHVYLHKDLAATRCPGRLTKKMIGV